MITLNTNSVAAKAAIDLSRNTFNLQNSLQRLSSGSRIANPGDDAGGLAVSMRLKAQINRTQGAQNNVSNALSFTQVQDGGLSTVGSIVDRMSELRSFADDVTKNSSDIANYNTEFQQLRNQLKNLVSEQFNGVSLFAAGGSATFGETTPSANQLTVYTTEAGATGATISLAKMALESALNVGNTAGGSLNANGVNVTFSAGNNLAAASSDTVSLQSFDVAEITQAIQNVATLRAQNAAASNRLQFASDQLSVNKTNLESARSRIFDVDVATESSALARNQVLVQSSTAMLAQANGLSGLALSLLS